ncbi:TolC family protein [Flavobacterium glaciei]|uniref:Outer membrane protein TolC n=1 Tax=Flavobacterium glaciei TaxID=386300 RepID=A0A562Q222_9FLAO|nr:TolC family protein [Flavobacterium glaciei]RDI57473.1 outer membrane protein TolC [Flavobacterium glaciei]TWI50725.1 outer membrane protein TolC [Flavobacterium glaciei]
MKVSQFMLFGIFFVGISSVEAQEKKSLTLNEAINLAWNKSNEVTLANTKVKTKKYELQSTKNNQYPDLKLSGQYQRLANASVDFKLSQDNSGTPQALPIVNQLMIGQLNASVPVFSGFKIQNSIKVYENLYEAEMATAAQTKEEIALRVIEYYASLYKAQKTIELLKENQKSAKQRVKDFVELEKNGIIPRNDLLKSKLQASKIQLSLDETTNNLKVINFYLVTLLKLNPDTKLEIREDDFADFQMVNVPINEIPALENRKDLEAIRFKGKASEANIKIAKGSYYPAIAIIGGYTALDLSNVITVQNAMNIGVGISYDLSAILKNGTLVRFAENKFLEVQNSEAILTDYIKVQVQKAIEDYDLALKQTVVYEEAQEQATENFRIVKDKYDNGLSDTNDLLEADVEQLNSKINQALAKANTIQKYYELLSVTGQLSQSFNLAQK